MTTPSLSSRSLRPFLYSSSMSSWHLYLISSASVRSLLFLSFIVPILAWNVPVISPIFLKRTLSSVAQWCPTPCDPMDCSMPGLPFHHQLPILAQTHVHWVGDAIQPSCVVPSGGLGWKFGLRPSNKEGTQPRPSTENWIKDLLSMAPPIRTRPSFPTVSLSNIWRLP